jgi:hypothetical protein
MPNKIDESLFKKWNIRLKRERLEVVRLLGGSIALALSRGGRPGCLFGRRERASLKSVSSGL